jgi:hypothetical protein
MNKSNYFELEGEVAGEESFLRESAFTKRDTNKLLDFENISIIKGEERRLSSSILDEPRLDILNFDKINGLALTEGNEQRKKDKKVTFSQTNLVKNYRKSLTTAKLNTRKVANIHQNNEKIQNTQNVQKVINKPVITPSADEKKHIEGSKSSIGLYSKNCCHKHHNQIKNLFNIKEESRKTKNFKNLKIDVSNSEQDDKINDIVINKPPSQRDSLSNHKISLFQPLMRFGKTMTPNRTNSSGNLNQLFPATNIVKKILPKSAKIMYQKNRENIDTNYNYLSEKISDIFDRKFEENVDKLLDKFKSTQQEIQSTINRNKDKLIETIQDLYEKRINLINETNCKYEDDLFTLKNMVDYLNPHNVNNIIYNSVMKDKMAEIEKIEENFRKQKEDVFNIYGVSQKKSIIKFDREIEDKTDEIKKSITTDLRSKIIHSLHLQPEETSQFEYCSDHKIDVDIPENGMRHTVSFKN